jgi:hypothetical protein
MPFLPTIPVACAVLAFAACSSSSAADITLYSSAIDTALKAEVFSKEGKYFLSGGPKSCSFASLEQPATKLRDGRILVRMRFAARAGVSTRSECVGREEGFWLTVSGRPTFRAEALGITDFRLEEGDKLYSPLLEVFLASVVPNAINLNLRQELMKLLASRPSPYKVSLPRLELKGVSAENDALKVLFDFSLEGR